MSVIKLKGCQVFKVIKYHKEFYKIVINYNSEFLYVIYRDKLCIKKGDYINIEGVYKIYNGNKEILANKISVCDVNSTINSGDFNEHLIRKRQLLSCRMLACEKIQEFMKDNNYIQVQSPTITSNWVEGKTTPFITNFHGTPAYLSISNMLYHQMMLSQGMNQIFELGKLHRQEKSGGKQKLSEFTILDISSSFSTLEEIMIIFEKVILEIWNTLNELNLYNQSLIKDVHFDQIDYNELLKKSNVDSNYKWGSQLPSECKKYMNQNYNSFIWVTNFDVSKRPFYTKKLNGKTLDAQLWYKGKEYFAAGSEIETDYNTIKRRMIKQGKNLENYDYYLKEIKKNFPPMTMIGMGVEKLLSHLLIDTYTYEFTWFSRYKGQKIF